MPELRRTGVDVIGDVPWGTHICQFYQKKADLVEVLVPYFVAGLQQNEFCMWITSEPLAVEDAMAALAETLGDLEPYFRTGQLEILQHDQWYTQDGVFEADRVLDGWIEKLSYAQQRGFEGLRLCGNTFWCEPTSWRDFAEYEAVIDSVIGQHPMLAICTYSLTKCGVPDILDVMANHPHALIKRGNAWQRVESAVRRKALETARADEQELAEERDRSRIELLRLLAHEIRNPMTGLRGLAQLVERKTPDDEVRVISRLMVGEVDRLSHILNGVLNAFRMQAGRLPLERKAVDFAALVEDSLNLFRAGGTHVYQVAVERPVSVAGDAMHLEDVVRNLLGNAVKYSPAGSLIQVDLARQVGRAVLSIRDNGVGIPAGQMDRIFEVFFRATNAVSLQPEGTGLGLYLCKNIVEHHGGRIWAESEEGKGSAFHVELPLAEVTGGRGL